MKKLASLLIFLSVLMAGCGVSPFLVSPIVTGFIIWKQGEAHKYYNEDAKVLYRATKLSLKELGHPITTDQSSGDGYYLVAGDKDKFKIKIRSVKPHISEVAVRINLMGDRPYAELLYSQIDANTDTINYDDEGKPTKNKNRRIRRSANPS